MIRDYVVIAVLALLTGAFATAHVTLIAGLLARAPRWRGALALCLPPAAPYFGFRAGMLARAWMWTGTLVLYVAARWVLDR